MASQIPLRKFPFILALAALLGTATGSVARQAGGDPIPYDEVLNLDAETLAEVGIVQVYDEIEPVIASHGGTPDSFREIVDEQSGSYAIEHRGVVYPVSGGDIGVAQGWGNAAAVFFEIVNRQMEGSEYRFYALDHGNGLQGVFLTDQQFAAARAFHRKGVNVPFVPTREPPMFGMPDDRR